MRAELTPAEERFVRLERVARLATVDADGQPFVVPVCPALDGDEVVVATETTAKVRHLQADPRCAIVFDLYHEDWDGLRQVQIRGRAEVLREGPAWDEGKALLDEKYPQYAPLAEIVPGQTTILRIRIVDVTTSGF